MRVNTSRAAVSRTQLRSVRSGARPFSTRNAATWAASSAWTEAGTAANEGNARPSFAAPTAADAVSPSAILAVVMASASGCNPSPNRARICASDTSPDTPSASAPRPCHRPGGVPLAV